MIRSRLLLGAAAFDASPSECAVVASDGTILAVNQAWRRFGEANGAGALCGAGANYLQVTQRAAAAGDEVAVTAAAALSAVLSRDAPRARMDYPCHSPHTQRWFRLHAELLPGRGDLLVVHDDITEHVQENLRLLEQATHDTLTGLANRTGLGGSGGPDVDRRAVSAQVTVLMVDLDRFKDVNDTYGHLAGDTVLEVVAARLQALVRSRDTVCRWGGDEFVLLLRGWRPAALAALVRRLDAVVREPIDVPPHQVRISASVGTALLGPNEDFHVALRRADEALYLAKAARAR